MTRRCEVLRWVGAVLILYAAMFGGAARSQSARPKQDEPEYTIQSTSRLVVLDISVKDTAGRFVSGLTKGNFRVFEDGKPQEISQFGAADTPVTVGIVVDESGSMLPKRPEVIAAALQFIHSSNPDDEIFVINFNEKARRGLPDIMLFSDDVKQLNAALWRGVPEGRTALYDAIEMALHQLVMGRRDRKAVVLISDGGDNVSVHKWPEVMHDVLASLVTIYTVGIFDEDDPEANPGVLKKLSQISGGEAYFPKTLPEVLPVCSRIARDIRERYTIGYIPGAEGKPVRHIRVEAFSNDHRKLNVRTRTTYMFAPDSEAANRR